MEWKKSLVWVLCAMIIAIGLCVAANTIADRPMQGNINGSIMANGSYEYPELMETQTLLDYLAIYPDKPMDEFLPNDDESQPPQPVAEYDTYEGERQNLVKGFEADVLSGAWPDFPYVQKGSRLYFSKAAVDDWFYEKGKQQLKIQ